MPAFISENMQWWVCGVIAVAGLVIYGFRDLLRLSGGRVWAISSVCFSESVRRRIWLITPLAIIGVIVVAQLQKPMDERDAIRQTIKFCLFATGLLVTITAIILACTNLPREIENRVIYTVVTKPTTRLEIVLGKILGFARVSALILLIMGLFSWIYLHVRAWGFDAGIRERLNTAGMVDTVSRPTLEYYRDAGLLTAREMAITSDMQIYSRLPSADDTRRYMTGAREGNFIVPFEPAAEDLIPPGLPPDANIPPGGAGLAIDLFIGAVRIPGYVDPVEASKLPPTVAAPNTQPTVKPPLISVSFLDASQSMMVPGRELNAAAVPIADPNGQQPTTILVPATAAQQLYKPGSDLKKPLRFYVQVAGEAEGYEYFVASDPISMRVPAYQGSKERRIKPASDHGSADASMQPVFKGREGTAGQQIRGGEKAPVAIYRFNQTPPADASGNVTFEFKSGIEKSAAESETEDVSTHVGITAFNRDSKQESPQVEIAIESNHQSYFRLPAQFLSGGNFDIRIKCLTPGHYLGLYPSSLGMVRAVQGFDINLIKSLFIMWLMAILVITIAIFTSTFLSWPTAIVLTLVILLGRWGVQQLGDATQPGIGNLIATDMGFTDPNKAKVVSSLAEAMAGGLNMLAKVLPDISQFAATEDIERGMVVPMSRLGDAAQVLLCYGMAILSLAYVRLTWTEVAP